MTYLPLNAAKTWEYRERIPIWVIYRTTTSDYPGKWTARMHLSLPQPESTELLIVGDSLEDVRNDLPPGLTCIGRNSEDEDVIEEVWI